MRQIDRIMEAPMIVLGFLWLALLVIELIQGLSRPLALSATIIWIAFVADFALKLVIAPQKGRFFRRNWLTALSLLVPALRLVRIGRLVVLLRVGRTTRGLRLFRLIASANRGLNALRGSMRRRGFGYVALLVVLVTFSGAAGMYAFERNEEPGLQSYSAALWWTAMMMTTVASDYYPRSPEGRLLCLLLATVAFTVWGYVTATLATFFVGRDVDEYKAQFRKNAAIVRESVEESGAASAEGEAMGSKEP